MFLELDEEFTQNPSTRISESLDDLCYELNYNNLGHALLINIKLEGQTGENWRGREERKGSEIDIKELYNAFKALQIEPQMYGKFCFLCYPPMETTVSSCAKIIKG